MILGKRSADSGFRSGAGKRYLTLAFALYCTAIICGAGVLGLPVLTATIGLLPAIMLTIVLGMYLTTVYERIASSIHEAVAARVVYQYTNLSSALHRSGVDSARLPELVNSQVPHLTSRMGVGILDAICGWLGFRRAGKFALTVGLFEYVVPATVAYVIGGARAITEIALRLDAAGVPWLMLALISALSGGISAWSARVLPRFLGRSALCLFLQMIASWLAAVAVVIVAPDWRPLPLLLFAASILGLILRRDPDRFLEDLGTGEDQQRTLDPAHQVSVMIALVVLSLLGVTALVALVTLYIHGALATPRPFPATLDPDAFSVAFGALLFAFTGTGILNLLRYPILFNDLGKSGGSWLSRVVKLGCIIPTIAYAVWMAAMAFAVPPEDLIQADTARSYPTVPLAHHLISFGSAGWIVFFAGFTVALMAVTSASLGFSESLANRVARLNDERRGKRIGDEPLAESVRNAQFVVLAIGTALAILLLYLPDAFSFQDILAVAGTCGGGMLLLVLPWFIPRHGQIRSPKRDIALATISVAILTALNFLAIPDTFGKTVPGTITGLVIGAFGAAFLIGFWGLVQGEVQQDAVEATAAPNQLSPPANLPAQSIGM